MLAVSGLNHITLAVANLSRSFDFYVGCLGLKPQAKWNSGAYLTAGDLWVCLSLDDAKPASDYTHVAFTVEHSDMTSWAERINRQEVVCWKDNTSEGASLYILDPDGHKLELHAGDLQSRLRAIREKPYAGLELFE